jgi:prophage maintenance system killer protein
MTGEDTKSIFELRNPEDRDARYERAVIFLPRLAEKNYPIEKVVRILNRLGAVDDEEYLKHPEEKGKYIKDVGMAYGGEEGISMGLKHEYVPETMVKFGECVDLLIDKETCDAYDIAAFSNLMLGVIHPFNEGNGRTSRLLMNYILVKRGMNPKNLDSELIEVHLDTEKVIQDFEIDHTRSFGRTIVEFSTLLNQKVYDDITRYIIDLFNKEGYYTAYPPGIFETKAKIIKEYIANATEGDLSKIPKVKQMSEIIKNLTDN